MGKAQLGLRHASQRRGPQAESQAQETGEALLLGAESAWWPPMTRGNRPGVPGRTESHPGPGTMTNALRKSCTVKAEALGPVGETRVPSGPGPAPPQREGRASLPLGGCTGRRLWLWLYQWSLPDAMQRPDSQRP